MSIMEYILANGDSGPPGASGGGGGGGGGQGLGNEDLLALLKVMDFI